MHGIRASIDLQEPNSFRVAKMLTGKHSVNGTPSTPIFFYGGFDRARLELISRLAPHFAQESAL